jgi:hypothetical protein
MRTQFLLILVLEGQHSEEVIPLLSVAFFRFLPGHALQSTRTSYRVTNLFVAAAFLLRLARTVSSLTPGNLFEHLKKARVFVHGVV